MLVYFTLGFIIGAVVMSIGCYSLLSGVLRIDQINSDKDIYRFEIKDLDKMSKKKYILIKIDANADLSHE